MKVVPLGAGVREPVLLAVAFLSGFSPTPELGGAVKREWSWLLVFCTKCLSIFLNIYLFTVYP